mmetsp:Transcript_7331/g.20380  ORF Transcript_7331/g.20380 Transcript_7331/m.20380 type:complete len:281 (-) Transcript_7331:2667-3509(-)
MGQCWQFHTEDVIRKPGLLGGLEVWLWLNQDDFDPSKSFAAVFIYIQQKGTLINDQLSFLTVRPGLESLVRLSKRRFVREVQSPWKKCRAKAPEYTQEKCRTRCINTAFYNTCGCRLWSDWEHTDTRYCGFFGDSTDGSCWAGFNETEVLDECNMNPETSCTDPPCDMIVYSATTTAVEYTQKWLEDFEEEDDDVPDVESFSRNYVGLYINYDQLVYEVLTQSPSISKATLLGSIGGSMGLFLGISALSVVEIFGDFCLLRLIPRLFGYRSLYGLGGRSN